MPEIISVVYSYPNEKRTIQYDFNFLIRFNKILQKGFILGIVQLNKNNFRFSSNSYLFPHHIHLSYYLTIQSFETSSIKKIGSEKYFLERILNSSRKTLVLITIKLISLQCTQTTCNKTYFTSKYIIRTYIINLLQSLHTYKYNGVGRYVFVAYLLFSHASLNYNPMCAPCVITPRQQQIADA